MAAAVLQAVLILSLDLTHTATFRPFCSGDAAAAAADAAVAAASHPSIHLFRLQAGGGGGMSVQLSLDETCLPPPLPNNKTGFVY